MSRATRHSLLAGVGLTVGLLLVAQPSSAGPKARGTDTPRSTTATRAPAPPPKLSEQQRLARLRHIHGTILGLDKRVAERRAARAAATHANRKAALGREIAMLERRIDGARRNFESLAADTTLDNLLHDQQQTERALVAELEELIGPVLDAFRRISARPRRIERLRRQIGFLTYFRVKLDHELIPIIETEVVPALRAGLTEALAEQLSGDDPTLRWISVDYDRADEGGLVLFLQAELPGREAGRMFKRGREMRLALLQVCRSRGWPLSHNQLFASALRVGPPD